MTKAVIPECSNAMRLPKSDTLDSFIQQGIDEADHGLVIGQEEMEAWFAARKSIRAVRIRVE